MGDYSPGTKLLPYRIEIEVDEGLRLSHVGIGYFLRLPSGKEHGGGYTWHSPRGGYAQAPAESVVKLREVVDELLKAAADQEGVEL